MLWCQLMIVPDGPHRGHPLLLGPTGAIFRHAQAEVEEEDVSSEDRSAAVVQYKVDPLKPTDTLTLKSKVLPQSVHAGADVSAAETEDLGASGRGGVGGYTAQEVFGRRVAKSLVMSEVAIVNKASERWWRVDHVPTDGCLFLSRYATPAHFTRNPIP